MYFVFHPKMHGWDQEWHLDEKKMVWSKQELVRELEVENISPSSGYRNGYVVDDIKGKGVPLIILIFLNFPPLRRYRISLTALRRQ